jgi:nitroreductase/dihydropteridine reductase
VYLALVNITHTLTRLGIASASMEGVVQKLIGEKFQQELDAHICEVALAMGYQNSNDDWNCGWPKARLEIDEIVKVV